MEDRKVDYFYIDGSDTKYVRVEYSSKTIVSQEEYDSICRKTEGYLIGGFDIDKDSIVDIVRKIREITQNVEENMLEVSIRKHDYNEYVKYVDGYIDSCEIYKEHFHDMIRVYCDVCGTDVRFMKNHLYLNTDYTIGLMNKQLKEFYLKVYDLYQLTKDNNKVDRNENNLEMKKKL